MATFTLCTCYHKKEKEKKPDTKEDIQYNSIKEKFKDKQTWSVVLETRRAFGSRDQEAEEGTYWGYAWFLHRVVAVQACLVYEKPLF